MNTICIIPCGKKKIWDIDPESGPVYAKNAYQGTLHKKCQQYADYHLWPWVTLSAKHGFLLPYDIVPENYDKGFHFPKHKVISDESLRRQWFEKNLYKADRIILLTGKKHERVMKRIVEDEDAHQWKQPLKGARGIGEMLQKLTIP
ncbi:DUF6884 domain-containing protein [Alteribacillus bidgolensis]|uniref:DUF6884 domain-containing protein n=1 Tax=Alteribacillus bidgolensis TaxID=930129 RepID=A0A1G8L6P4_9BACI|nr:DUF6884 domain-containing protein [Alteribacillus bidgolensis]SDI51261.1 hypothetical protein SAMN05216352_108177 [Alteribacillus bidgolensis]